MKGCLGTGDNAQQVDEVLRFLADMAANDVAAGGRVKDSEVDVGVGVGGVEKAAEVDEVEGSPKFEDAVDVGEVVEEAVVLLPALASAHRVEEGEREGRLLLSE